MIYIMSLLIGLLATSNEDHLLPKKVDNKFLFLIYRSLTFYAAGAILGLAGFLVKINGFTGGFLLLVSGLVIFIIAISHLPIFPKIVVIGLKSYNHSTKALVAGITNIFASSASLHIVMVMALSHGYYFESGFIVLLFAVGSTIKAFRASIRRNKFTHTLQMVLFLTATLFILNKGLLYTQLFLFSPFESSKTAIVPEILDNKQFLKTNLKHIDDRILIGSNMPVNWLLEGQEETIYIPAYKHKSKITEESDFLELDPTNKKFIYFTRGLGKGDYILMVVGNIQDFYNLPYNKVIDSGFKSIHEDEEIIAFPEIEVKTMSIATLKEGSQNVDIIVNSNGYSPSVVVLQAGVPAKLNFKVTELTDENYRILIPSYNQQLEFGEGDYPINIPKPLVDFTFYSWGGKFGGYVLVVDSIEGMTLEKAQRRIRMLNVDGI